MSKKIEFSKDQLSAIQAEGINYLISAGAGSGKTAVLTERIYRIAKRDNTLDKFLVLTFTNLAAGEMKNRVRKLLIDDEETQHLASEVDNAHIETFDSFSLYLVKKYFYVLGISKNLNIVDQSILTIKRRMLLDEVIEKHIQDGDESLNRLVLAYSIKNLDKIKEYIINILVECDRKGDKDEFFRHLHDDFFKEETVASAVKAHHEEILEYIHYIRESAANNLSDIDDVNQIEDFMDELESIKDYNDLLVALKEKSFPRKPKGCLEPEIRDALKDLYVKKVHIKEKENDYGDLETISSLYLGTEEYAKKIIEIAKEVEDKLDEYKNEHNAYSFGDISRFVLKLLKNENIRKEISLSFNYIMVDEYQDTNDIQEAVISSISRNNVYMVGDVKQSIYKFRGADCRVFQEKYEKYKKNLGGKEIDLNESYRSRKEVVDFINELFGQLMTKDINSIDYANGHTFGFGRKDYEVNKPSVSYKPEVYHYNKQKGDDTSKIEAEIIAKDILKKRADKFPIFVDKGETRKCDFKDFAIIIDRSTDFDTYRDVLSSYNIPIKVENKEKLFDSEIILVVKSLLKMLAYALDSDYGVGYKHAFFSVARSFLLEYKDDNLYQINKYNTYLLEPFAQKIELHKESLRFASLKNVLLFLYKEFEIYESISKIANYYSNTHKLESIINLAENMDVMGYTISDFVKYFDDLSEFDIDIDYRDSDAQSNSVTLINIHGSKGLEYGIVYFPGLSKQFNDRDSKSSFMLSDSYGVIIPPVVSTNVASLFNHLTREEKRHADFEEKIRLLYVALTRTKEKIILLSGDVENEKSFYRPTDAKNMKRLLGISDVLTKYSAKFPNEAYTVVEKNEEIITNKITLKTLHIPAQLIKKERASKEINEEIDASLLDFGTELHAYLESLDFESDDLSYIKDSRMRKYVFNVKNSELFKGVKNSEIRHEYEFYDEENNLSGFIDALIIKEDEVDIIDFKLKNIDDDKYDRQLRIYKRYIKKQTSLPIKMYLLAAITGEVREVQDE